MIKKLCLLLTGLFFTATICSAQFTMTLQVPPVGVLLKPQLWNAIIINSYPETRRVFLGLTLSVVATGEPVLTATTSQITLETGAMQVQSTNLSPINYTYLSSRITDLDPDGFLPAGNYTACYTLFVIEEGIVTPIGEGGTPLLEDCIPVTVEPVSPPILNTPFDEQILETHLPQFTWIPPTPIEIFYNLNYDMVLVEVQDGQSAADAIQQNIPVYTGNQSELYLNYPSSAGTLDTGKIYAWQVIAKNDNEFAGQSEVWTFRISSDPTDSTFMPEPTPFIRLKKEMDAAISVVADTLHIAYSNEAADSAVYYEIAGIDEDVSQGIIMSDSLVLIPGDNMVSFPLRDNSDFIAGRSYIFRLTNSRNEIWRMKFIFQRQEQ